MTSLTLPRSWPKAALLSICCGAICGMAFFVLAGSRLAYSSPIGDMFLFLYALGCGTFGMMTAAWGTVAALNRKNKKIFAFTGSITLLLGIVTFSFFAKQIIQTNG
ncbi:MAG: hypothetical protein WCG66_07625 [bacterium]